MARRVRFGSVTNDSLDSLDAQLGTGNENGNNPDNDLVARDSNGNIVLRYDESAGAWNFEDVDITGVGSLSTDERTINEVVAVLNGTTDTSVGSGTPTTVDWDNIDKEDSGTVTVDLANNEIDVDVDGDYLVIAATRWGQDSNWSTGDSANIQGTINGSLDISKNVPKVGTARQTVSFVSYLENLSANDTIAIEVFQDSGSTISLDQDSNRSEFAVYRMA